jgi:hypothetical protein
VKRRLLTAPLTCLKAASAASLIRVRQHRETDGGDISTAGRREVGGSNRGACRSQCCTARFAQLLQRRNCQRLNLSNWFCRIVNARSSQTKRLGQ